MFHTYTYPSTAFQDWLKAADQLYLTQHLHLGGRKKDYQPLHHQLKPQSQDQFILYVDDQMGVCGSAILTPLPHDVEIEGQLISEGIWALGHVSKHVRCFTIRETPLTALSPTFMKGCLIISGTCPKPQVIK